MILILEPDPDPTLEQQIVKKDFKICQNVIKRTKLGLQITMRSVVGPDPKRSEPFLRI